MDVSAQCTAVYVALITVIAFMYIRMRRLEAQLQMTNATIDVLMSEDLPASFCPELRPAFAASSSGWTTVHRP